MSIVDTYKYGSLWVDAQMTLSNMKDEGLTDTQSEIIQLFEESGAEFKFEPHSIANSDMQYIDCGWYGGYPGTAMDDANAQAALEWSDGRGSITAFRMSQGGCETIQLCFDWVHGTVEDAEAIIELVEGFQDYPVIDEDLWSRLESERFMEMVDEMIVDTENKRDIVFTEDQRHELVESAQNYYGYWEEGYFDVREWEKIVSKVLNEDCQLHQNERLF